jgi:hypothetical protein
MLNTPNPALNEEEAALLAPQPEECLRRAVQRGAISLDQVTEGLAPHVAAAVRGIVTGERLPAPSAEGPFPDLPEDLIHSFEQARGHPPTAAELEQAREFVRMQTAQAQKSLAPYPQLQRLLEEQILDGGGAIAAANAIDHALGRYLTGTRYAAP